MTTDKPYMDIEIFPCAGGMGEGFRRAGVIFDLMIEIEKEHCDSYEANLGHRPTQMDARSFHEMLEMGWRPPKPVRFLCADPPCTPWSRAGKRKGLEDPRDMLWGTCEIIKLLKPSVYLIGNVPGLDDGPNLPIVQRTIGALSSHGYCTADFARLDAANYGVPQHMHRPFWFGHQTGPCILWPAPTHGDPDELRDQMVIPGIDALLPWVTCKQALGHLPLELLGRPIKLRKRGCNSKQHGSVEERPARTVGTSNLSDGNVILSPDAPRAGKRGKKKVGQGDRVGDLDAPSATITRNGGTAGRGPHSQFALSSEPPDGRAKDHGPSQGQRITPADHAAPTIRGGGEGHSAPPVVIHLENDKHPNAQLDEPAPTIGNKPRQSQVLSWSASHPPSFANEPAMTQRATSGGGAVRAMTWPWDRPSTTVLADERLGPPGHHDEDYRILTTEGDGIVISELAAAILQGFPDHISCGCGRKQAVPWEHGLRTGDMCEGCGIAIAVTNWEFCGATKKTRFSQLGQAMPPPLAHAVATSVVAQIQKTQSEIDEDALRVRTKALAKGYAR